MLFDDQGNLRQKQIDENTKMMIENSNSIKENLNQIISKCKHLVGSFKHSDSLNSKLLETQNALGYEIKIKLIQDVVTRWNSTFKMLESIIINEDALKSMAMLPECKCIKDYVPNSEEFDLIKEICKILVPLNDLTEVLSGSRYCTISILMPSIYGLLNYELNEVNILHKDIVFLKTELL